MSWLSSLLGLDAQHNAGVALNQSQQQYQEAQGYRQQAGNNYNYLTDLGLNANAAAYGAGNTGNSGYTQLAQQGAQDDATYNQMMPGILAQYLTTSGLDGSGGANGTLSGAGAGSAPGTAGGSSSYSPYQLTEAQQTQLNGNLDTINQQQTAALQHYQADLAKRGITDPQALAVGEAAIKQSFGQQATQHAANFAETARANKQNALSSLMTYMSGLQNTGNAATESANAGINNMIQGANGLSSLASSAQSGSAQSASQSNYQQQMANGQYGSLLNLGAFALSGGFGAPTGSGGAATGGAVGTTNPAGANASPYGV